MTIRQTKGIAALLGASAYAAGLAAISTLIWALWNILVPPVTGWAHISWIQALGLRVLASLFSTSIRTSTEFGPKTGADSSHDIGGESSQAMDQETLDGLGAGSVSARKDDDGGYTIKIDFTGSDDDEDEEE